MSERVLEVIADDPKLLVDKDHGVLLRGRNLSGSYAANGIGIQGPALHDQVQAPRRISVSVGSETSSDNPRRDLVTRSPAALDSIRIDSVLRGWALFAATASTDGHLARTT